MALKLLIAAVFLNWLMVTTASLWRANAWTPGGMMAAVGPRDVPIEPSVYAGRAERAAKNMSENLPFFIAVVLAAYAAGRSGPGVDTGALVFVIARVVYWPVYISGIPFLRTGVWAVSIGALAWIGYAAL